LDKNSLALIALAIASAVSLSATFYPFKPLKSRGVAISCFLISATLAVLLASKKSPEREGTLVVGEDSTATPTNETKLWVTSERLNRRTCPSESCGIVGQYFFREAVTIHEQRDGWVRVSQHYDASCVNGKSQYVDVGNAACDPANGIIDGKFAEWVSANYLSESRPPDPAEDALESEELVADSDDFARYREIFAVAAQSLIRNGLCTEREFRDSGGWVKSTNHRNEPVYFIYCGGFTTANRLYLNARTGDIFR